MTQLTKEHLDKALDKHFKKVDQRFEKMDRRFDAQTKELKAYTDERFTESKAHTSEQIEGLARMVQRGFQEMSRKLDIREEVDKPKHQMRQVRHDPNFSMFTATQMLRAPSTDHMGNAYPRQRARPTRNPLPQMRRRGALPLS